jgi:hypothetical protein
MSHDAAPRHLGRVGVVAAVALVVAPVLDAAVGTAWAGNGAVQFILPERLEVDSNPLMLRHGAERVMGSVTSPEIGVSSDTPTDHFGINTRVDRSFYDVKGFSSTDVHSRANVKTKGEVWEAGLSATFDYDTTRTSEQEASALNIAGIRHTGLTLSPLLTTTLSETDSLILNPSLTHSYYANKLLYTNYTVYAFNPSYQHSFDPRNTGMVILQSSRYQTERMPRTVIDNIGPALGWTSAVSEKLTATVTAGVRRTMPEYDPASRTVAKDTWNYGYSLSLTYKGEQDLINLDVSRAPNPYATGTQAETTVFTLTETHTLTPTLSYTVSVSDQQSKSTSGGITNDMTSLSLLNRLTFHLTETVDLGVEHRIRERMSDPGEGRALGNLFMARIVYTPEKFAFNW